MTLLGSFPGSFLLPHYQAAILAGSSCLFDASSLVFAVFNPLNSSNPELFSRKNLFLGYSVLALVLYGLIIFCWWQLERKDWKTVVDAEAAQAKQDALNDGKDEENKESTSSEPVSTDENSTSTSMMQKHMQRVKDTGLHEMALGKQIRTFDFGLVLLFVSFHMLRTNFLIESVNEIVATYGDDDGFYAKVFGFVLPAGVFFIPFIEFTINKYGVVASLDVTNVLGVVLGIFASDPLSSLTSLQLFYLYWIPSLLVLYPEQLYCNDVWCGDHGPRDWVFLHNVSHIHSAAIPGRILRRRRSRSRVYSRQCFIAGIVLRTDSTGLLLQVPLDGRSRKVNPWKGRRSGRNNSTTVGPLTRKAGPPERCCTCTQYWRRPQVCQDDGHLRSSFPHEHEWNDRFTRSKLR